MSDSRIERDILEALDIAADLGDTLGWHQVELTPHELLSLAAMALEGIRLRDLCANIDCNGHRCMAQALPGDTVCGPHRDMIRRFDEARDAFRGDET
jgi:hypothetical protein